MNALKLSHSDLKTLKLSSQWPKRCNCCQATYLPGAWDRLPFAYKYTDEFATQEARHCACKTTLVVNTEIHDLSAE